MTLFMTAMAVTVSIIAGYTYGRYDGPYAWWGIFVGAASIGGFVIAGILLGNTTLTATGSNAIAAIVVLGVWLAGFGITCSAAEHGTIRRIESKDRKR